MAVTINADDGAVSGSAGLKYSSDSTGVLALQTNGTTAVSISTGQVVTLAQPLPVASGGTGGTSNAAAPFALKGANSDITQLSGLTTALSVGQGGTGAATATAGFNALAPSQTGNSGKYLSTDGTNTSWGALSVTPTAVSDQTNSSTGYFDLPAGTTAQRPGSPAVGMIRYNSSLVKYEVYLPSGWASIGFGSYSVESIIVAGGGGGGGGGGYEAGGGGGAGGYITASATFTTGEDYTVTVGAGGAATGGGGAGANGSASSITSGAGLSLTTIGGGGGAASNQGAKTGGSGGGGQNWSGTSGAAGTAGQGNPGGNGGGSPSPGGPGGGGGGKSAAGNSPGTGGAGLADTWTGSSRTLAGGGGGAGGYGGGAGGGGSTGANGTANTGGGGGGTNSAPTTGGGSGIVVIRYLGSQRGSGGTVTSSGGYTLHTFTSSGTYTA